MKRDTWIPYTNSTKVTLPRWVDNLDSLIGKLMCRLGFHSDTLVDDCWYCERKHHR